MVTWQFVLKYEDEERVDKLGKPLKNLICLILRNLFRTDHYACRPILMAELHILGQLECAHNFKEPYSLFCRYSFQAGPNWTLISGYSEGQTNSAKADFQRSFVWNQPIDLHYVSKGIQGWPKIILQASCLDSIGRSWIVGYGSCGVPSSPGQHIIQVPCWVPAATTVTDKLKQIFIGGTHQLTQTDIINLGSDRFKLITQSKGDIELKIYIILRNFNQFGVEYK